MELYQLRTFVIVAEEENLTRAAKRLYMTPPSVSAHIKTLEEELNVQLFERTPKGMEITEQGKLLKAKVPVCGGGCSAANSTPVSNELCARIGAASRRFTCFGADEWEARARANNSLDEIVSGIADKRATPRAWSRMQPTAAISATTENS